MQSAPSVMNDGLGELIYSSRVFSRYENIKMALKSDPKIGQGTQHYMDEIKIFRFKNIKIINENKPNAQGEKPVQRVGCDGEDLFFQNFVKIETL